MRRLALVIGVCFLILALYSIANTSDRMDDLTVQQQSEIVGRWWK